MLKVRSSGRQDIPALKALWKEAFGDSDEDIDLFYDTCWRPEETLLLVEGEQVMAMTALLPHTLTLVEGGEARGAYVYALATALAQRGRGCARYLLMEADKYAKNVLGAQCATVVPAERSLHTFFAGSGFEPCFFTGRVELDPVELPAVDQGDRLEPLSAVEYGELRKCLLQRQPAVNYPAALLEFQAGMCRLAGGGLFRVVAGGAEGCAALEYRDAGRLVLKELLLPPEWQSQGVAAIAEAFPAKIYEVRTPKGWQSLFRGEIWPFGRIKWYDKEAAARSGVEGYFGLGFD